MGLFGPSKKEIALKNQIEELTAMLMPEQKDIIKLKKEISELSEKKDSILKSIDKYNNESEKKLNYITQLEKQIKDKSSQIFSLSEEIDMQEYGIYRPTYAFANSDLYMDRLKEIRNEQKECIKKSKACLGNYGWSVNGSSSKGQKMVKDMQKLLLRAFNLECDNIIDTVKISNFDKAKERIIKSSEQISKLGSIMSISITDKYINLKILELVLALDYQQKKQQEKDAIKALKEQEREEKKLQKEIEEAKGKLRKEQLHYKNALNTILTQIENNGETPELLEKKQELLLKLEDNSKALDNVDYREANKRAGYVYIISNIGAFGENVYKIGMTRRLEPLERIDELGDASVPFDFDVHALIFTDDAPKLENALHTAFERKKLTKVNFRREFFNVTLDEIKTVVRENFDKTVEWVDVAPAEQYRQSIIKN